MKVVRMLAVRDEADILEANLRWFEERGISTVAIDDFSTDGSAEILEEAAREGRVAAFERWGPTDRVPWHALLARMQAMAAEERPDVLLLTAADEFFEVGDGSDLVAAIEADVGAGATVLDFKNMEFHMTDLDGPAGEGAMRRMRHYSHREVGMYRGVSWAPGTDFASHLGHRPILPGALEWRVSPRLYVSRHYPLRSPQQLERKLARIVPPPGQPNVSNHYLRLIHGVHGALVPAEFLTRYEDDHRWELEEKVLPWRLRETTAALGRAHLRIEELEAELRLLDPLADPGR